MRYQVLTLRSEIFSTPVDRYAVVDTNGGALKLVCIADGPTSVNASAIATKLNASPL